ncbi:hypothetical protein N7468_008542 [Penicillium chermesinum]|uniref:Uncharacterized protein n=1 Tax=Penicillium chermesinum TaxID=63820 RepID=A0A9W9TJZ1_9EURO|nr:uncharacterized protein N7468_008542 [Penicillium chermesinum]KAJ5224000.1 hypothetical protein N7468_008542 [Penicillium chermesinum]
MIFGLLCLNTNIGIDHGLQVRNAVPALYSKVERSQVGVLRCQAAVDDENLNTDAKCQVNGYRREVLGVGGDLSAALHICSCCSTRICLSLPSAEMIDINDMAIQWSRHRARDFVT